jgi:hypothetical protein
MYVHPRFFETELALTILLRLFLQVSGVLGKFSLAPGCSTRT